MEKKAVLGSWIVNAIIASVGGTKTVSPTELLGRSDTHYRDGKPRMTEDEIVSEYENVLKLFGEVASDE